MRLHFYLIFLFGAISSLGAHRDASASFPFARCSNVSFPIRDVASGKIAAIIHIRDLQRDHQRKGFFKIGIMPFVLATDVLIEIKDEGEFQKNFIYLERDLNALAQNLPLELRGLRFVQPGRTIPVLEADCARIQRNQGWDLQGARFSARGSSMKVPRARLLFNPAVMSLQVTSGTRREEFNLLTPAPLQLSNENKP
jgi:hypothetical protein